MTSVTSDEPIVYDTSASVGGGREPLPAGTQGIYAFATTETEVVRDTLRQMMSTNGFIPIHLDADIDPGMADVPAALERANDVFRSTIFSSGATSIIDPTMIICPRVTQDESVLMWTKDLGASRLVSGILLDRRPYQGADGSLIMIPELWHHVLTPAPAVAALERALRVRDLDPVVPSLDLTRLIALWTLENQTEDVARERDVPVSETLRTEVFEMLKGRAAAAGLMAWPSFCSLSLAL